MRFTSKMWMILVVGYLLAGCAAAMKPDFKPVSASAGKGVIYVYMPAWPLDASFKGTGTLSVGKKELGNVGAGLYYAAQVAPGTHTVTFYEPMLMSHWLTKGNKTSVNVRAGQKVYVRLSREMITPTVWRLFPQKVDAATGKREIQKTRPG